ncbi:MAG: hypothetical protein JWN62_3793, partial [Acidimicrobiales bacterium]|nr:hypothetical protein [Acidimicrobiales bacterium]
MRLLIGLVATCVIGGSLSTAAFAADDGHSDGSGGVDNSYLYAGVQYGTPPSAKNKKDGNGCVWVPAAEASTFDSKVIDTRVIGGVTQHLFLRACPRSIQGVWVSQVPSAKLGQMSTDYLRQRLPQPSFNTAPASTQGVVNVDMWIWTDPA